MEILAIPFFKELIAEARSFKTPLYVVGGAVRDRLLNRDSTDFDLTGNRAVEIARAIASKTRYTLVKLDDTPGRETLRVIVTDPIQFDFTTLQGEDIESDLKQRDYTLNALAISAEDFINEKDNYIDPCKGQADIESKTIRAVSARSLEEDPLRMLRGIRFAALLDFSIDPETLNQIAQRAERLRESAAERVLYELKLYLGSNNATKHFGSLYDCGLFKILFPGVTDSKEILKARLALIESNTPLPQSPDEEEMVVPRRPNPALLKLSALLFSLGGETDHDISPIADFLKSMKASNAEIATICHSIQTGHLFLKGPQESGDAAMYRFCRQTHPSFKEGLALAGAVNPQWSVDSATGLRSITSFYETVFLPGLDKEALINGNDLIHNFNIHPGPLFKTILDAVEEAKVLGSISNKEEALAFAKNMTQKIQFQQGEQ
ncbi:MAG: CCA tRNA nucleotidyltransferase [Candidatus Nitrohelix vancouverensis]|uniref:CCA tRNA nucleotidyltransferase n=1 Tax=Candidatus Nitrohelix vancouverensis TaxID=2705534 RepID=A0A7T0G3U7_9BACT|nr:MAG: CCA tRNA nucleotidyltransferase [Candidatus Nitrohelix vancouverensis]